MLRFVLAQDTATMQERLDRIGGQMLTVINLMHDLTSLEERFTAVESKVDTVIDMTAAFYDDRDSLKKLMQDCKL